MNKPPMPPMPRSKPKGKGGRNYKGVGKKFNQTDLAATLGVSRDSIKRWETLGLPSISLNVFDLAEVVRWRIEHETELLRRELARQGDEDENQMSGFDAKRRKEVAQALTAELHLAKERELLANIDDLMELFSEALIEVRAKLISLSSRKSGELSHQDQEGVAKILDKEIADMLEVLSNYE